MRFEHPTVAIIVAILLGAVVLGAGMVAGTVVMVDESADNSRTDDVTEELTGDPGDGSASIEVSGSGTVTAEPDQAVIVLAATARADNASAATSELAAQVDDLRDSFADQGLGNDSYRTIDYRVGQEPAENGSVFVARQTLEVRLNDTDAVGETVDRAVENGASEVFEIRFTLSDERERELRKTAIDRAVADAREQAEAVAHSTNLSVGDVDRVSLGGASTSPYATESAAEAGDTQVDASPVSVSVRVEVSFNATPD